MIVFPNAKVNIGLQVTGKRADGYHNLDTVFYPIPLRDSLEIIVDKHPSDDAEAHCRLNLLGHALEGNPDDNLVVRAWRLLREEGYEVPSVEVWLYKQIPSGAGLGGGSSDAAFMLSTLDSMLSLHIGQEELERLAGKLGADCPFFIENKPARATGTGNILTPLSLSLSGYDIVVVKPPVFVSTREAYSRITPALPETTLEEKIQLPVSLWKEHITNDFEACVFPLHPELPAIKQKLYDSGAVYASMSGSGSALYGLFPSGACKLTAQDFEGCFVWKASL
ncbi:MAG: 4-(cytidine 5'-diphospho)-2-C-methyl-D-erythritol kinase [Bacteroidaceae bacterium]|nr:4-(cytidine 5'-diphospho)-2-C-methyl-D-erythritol kinase [Bacteroidaceae bacterium]